ncbi:MAG: molybdenum cofactor guanylyltransferase MobA [Proteobacteria bacterium]|nr:molybdenum cofactor guanylyltransferase MobA [Pseudomonadota bacterium]
MKAHRHVVGVLLAGGQARRMAGGDKCLQRLGGETLLARAIARARPQVDSLILNANGDPARFGAYGIPVVPDVIDGFAGPLAGILTAMEWAAQNATDHETVVSFPTDAPFFPDDLVDTMLEARRQAGALLACAASRGRTHPVFGVWPVNLRADLRHALEQGERKIDRWTDQYPIVTVEFSGVDVDPFFNANTLEDLAQAERLLQGPTRE